LRTQIVVRHPLVVALPKTNRLSKLKRIPLSALANQPYILFNRERSPVFYDYLIGLCHHAGITLNIRHEATHPATILGLVAAGLGITLIPFGGFHTRSDVIFRKLAPKPPLVSITLAWRSQNESELLRTFIAAICRRRGSSTSPKQSPGPS
jgi:DNA-binding transcriptional LysR family regulator